MTLHGNVYTQRGGLCCWTWFLFIQIYIRKNEKKKKRIIIVGFMELSKLLVWRTSFDCLLIPRRGRQRSKSAKFLRTAVGVYITSQIGTKNYELKSWEGHRQQGRYATMSFTQTQEHRQARASIATPACMSSSSSNYICSMNLILVPKNFLYKHPIIYYYISKNI